MGFDFAKYNKIILVGSPGSGKSWLSKLIAEITAYPLYHLDMEFWKPNWVMASREYRLARQQEIISGEKWIIEGNYNETVELRFANADLIIYLDINRLICIWRGANRMGKKRSDFPDYLDEPKVTIKVFINICKSIWNARKTNGKIIMELHEKYPEKEFLHIKSRGKVKKLLL